MDVFLNHITTQELIFSMEKADGSQTGHRRILRLGVRRQGQGGNTFYDWFLIWMIAGVGVTGLGAEILRLVGVVKLGYLVYYLHLVSVMMLFLYMPYTKFAHLIYRTCAMTFERYRDSAYVKSPVK